MASTPFSGRKDSIRIRRFRVRAGLDTPFTRQEMTLVTLAVVADAGEYTTLVELSLAGEDAGNGRRISWHANPSKRLVTRIGRQEAEGLVREAAFRVRYGRSTLGVGGRKVTLIEFDSPLEDRQFVHIAAPIGDRADPPEWAAEEVTHDPSTDLYQIAVDAFRTRRDPLADLGF